MADLESAAVAELDQAYQRDGMTGYWRKRLELEEGEAEETGNSWPMLMVTIHARLGHVDQALAWLDRAIEGASAHPIPRGRSGLRPAAWRSALPGAVAPASICRPTRLLQVESDEVSGLLREARPACSVTSVPSAS